MTAEMPQVQPLTYTETCRLCGKKFTGPPLQSPNDPRMQKLGEALFKHMFNTDEAHKTYGVISIVLAGFLIEDPAAQQFAAGVRYANFQALRRKFVPDEQLHAIVSGLAPAEFEAAMMDMRDFLTEQNAHAPFVKMDPPPNGTLQ